MGFRNRLNLPPGSITAALLADGSVTGTKLSADAIDGKTITGALFRTAATGTRWEMDSFLHADELRGFTGWPGENNPALIQVAPTQLTLQSANFGAGASALYLMSDATGNQARLAADGGVNMLGGPNASVFAGPSSGGGLGWAGLHQVTADAAGIKLDTTATGATGGIALTTNATGKITTNATVFRDLAWTAVTRVNGWVDFAGSRLGYVRDSAGNARLRGVVASGTAALIGTLPVGYRPTQGTEFPLRGDSGAASVMVVVLIDTNGQISVQTNLASAQVRLGLDLSFSTI